MRYQTVQRFKNLVYFGDWHTLLNTALDLACEETKAPRLRELITELKKELNLSDECIHTVKLKLPLSYAIDAIRFVNRLKESAPASVSLELAEPRELLISITERGSLENVNADAMYYLRQVKNEARQLVYIPINMSKSPGVMSTHPVAREHC